MCHIWTKGEIRFVSRVILFIINKLLTYQKPIFCKSNLMFAPQGWGLWGSEICWGSGGLMCMKKDLVKSFGFGGSI